MNWWKCKSLFNDYLSQWAVNCDWISDLWRNNLEHLLNWINRFVKKIWLKTIHIYTSLIGMPGTSQVGLLLTQRASENLHGHVEHFVIIIWHFCYFVFFLSLSFLTVFVLIHVHYIKKSSQNIIQNHFYWKLVSHGGLEQNEGK